jgi:hypothetical protein
MRTPFIVPVLVISVLAACGGGHKNQNTNTYSAPAGNAASHANAAPEAQVPTNLHCGAVSPVWANTRTHVYHVSSDPMYGRTKHGEYMCPQQAVREGYHQSGSGGSMYGSKREHRKHHGGTMMAQPSPSPGYP